MGLNYKTLKQQHNENISYNPHERYKKNKLVDENSCLQQKQYGRGKSLHQKQYNSLKKNYVHIFRRMFPIQFYE